MSAPLRYAYLHGFASGPLSRKAVALEAALAATGRRLERPDLNVPSFARLTYTGALSAIDALDAAAAPAGAPWRFVGSSMGGYLAARWAELNPTRVDRLVLLCPGFRMTERWPALVGPEGMTRWRAHGAHTFPDGAGTPTPVHWGFIEDALEHPGTPEVPCPTLIVHGRHDAIVPIALSREYAASRPHVRLLELDDDHALTASLPAIEQAVLDFFA